MSIKSRMKSYIKSNNFLYTFFCSIQRSRDKEFQKMVRAMGGRDATLLLVEGNYNLNNEIYYIIECGFGEKKDWRGFFALIGQNLRSIYFAQTYHLKPCIVWGKNSLYYDTRMDKITENAFEYFFEPLSLEYEEILKEHLFVKSRGADSNRITHTALKGSVYHISDEQIEVFASLYRRYFHLNSATKAYIDTGINKIMGKDEKVIGVHVRGTDFKNQFYRHPEFCGFEPFLEAAKKIVEEGGYSKIFLATDDEEAIELFRHDFGSTVVFYEDCQRAKGNLCVMCNEKAYPYEMGLEVLRDVYTLVHCDALICGLSQVAFAAQYIKKSQTEEFSYIKQIDMKINSDGKGTYLFYDKINKS